MWTLSDEAIGYEWIGSNRAAAERVKKNSHEASKVLSLAALASVYSGLQGACAIYSGTGTCCMDAVPTEGAPVSVQSSSLTTVSAVEESEDGAAIAHTEGVW